MAPSWSDGDFQGIPVHAAVPNPDKYIHFKDKSGCYRKNTEVQIIEQSLEIFYIYISTSCFIYIFFCLIFLIPLKKRLGSRAELFRWAPKGNG
jgi:hypothetical protein